MMLITVGEWNVLGKTFLLVTNKGGFLGDEKSGKMIVASENGKIVN